MFTASRTHPMSLRAALAGIGMVIILTISLAATAVTLVPGLAKAAPMPIAFELLTQRAVFTDRVDIQVRNKFNGAETTVLNMPDASRTLVVRFTVQPGAQFPWHTHPGPVIVNVQQGTLIYVQASDCVERSYPAGTAFVDPGRGNVHTAYNPSESGETILVATFFDFPADGPLSIADARQDHCAA